jgi:hypothetical protein
MTIGTLGAFLFFSLWWVIDILNGTLQHEISLIPHLYGVISIWGGVLGVFYISKQWGGLKSIVGRAVFFFSLGLFFQAFGQIVYSLFYFILHIEVPYPSIGDIGFFGSIPAYCLGVWYLGKASGIRLGIREVKSKILAVVIPSVVLLLGYALFLHGYSFDWSDPIKIFLDFGYPFGEAAYLSLTLLTIFLTKNVLGGIMRLRVVIILLALIMQFIADYFFLYQAQQQTWHPGGINDYMYLVAYTLMNIALAYFSVTANQLKAQSSSV